VSRVIGIIIAAVVAGVVLLGDDSGDIASDYDPTGSTLDYHAPDGFNAGSRVDQVVDQANDYEPGDGVTGL
jgi:hypothetical protein